MQIAHKNEQRVRKNVVTLHCQIKTNKVSSSLSGTQKEVIINTLLIISQSFENEQVD